MLKIDIITEDKDFYQGEADFVLLPGGEGEIGILPGHLPLLSTLSEGQVRVQKDKATQSFQISGGFVEVRDDLIQIITREAAAV